MQTRTLHDYPSRGPLDYNMLINQAHTLRSNTLREYLSALAWPKLAPAAPQSEPCATCCA